MKLDFDNPTLNIFLNNPQQEYYLRELEIKLKRNPKLLFKDLHYFIELDILVVKKYANIKKYKLKKDSEFVKSLQRMWILYLLKPLINVLKNKVDKIILYGSFANQTYVSMSDIDILVLTDEHRLIVKEVSDLEHKLNKEASFITMSSLDYYRKLKNKESFINNVDSNGIIVYTREPNEFE